MKHPWRAAVLGAALCSGLALASPSAQDLEQRRQLLASLQYQAGDIALPDAHATLHVQPGFKYLGHDDTRKVLEQYWGNPEDDDVLGLLVPDNAPLASDHSWAVVVTYSDEGYVSDADANAIDAGKLLAEMQQSIRDQAEERKSAGYGTIELVDWALPPHYDAAGKRLQWAKELEFDGDPAHTVNYDIRVLGRGGFLSLNAVAAHSDLAMVRDGMTRVFPMAEFEAGHRYADYQPGSDKLAAYGLATLVGGGLAAKAGLFAKLGVFLLAAKKFIVLLVLGAAAMLRKLFGGTKDDSAR